MSFASKVWRLLVGIKDALVLLILLAFFTLLFAALSFRPSPASVHDGALLLQLNGSVVEERAEIAPLQVLLSGTLPTREYAARDLVDAIDGAAGDKRIKAIALDMSTFLGGGQVHMQEIGAALDRFRAAKKPVFAYAVAYSDDSLMLAAHSSEVWIDPMGGALVRGPGGKTQYYGALLKRFGVKAHVFRVGTYKSAVEPYMLDAMSPAAREDISAIYAGLWEEWQANVRAARPQAKLARAVGELPALIAENGGDLAKAAVAAGLVDRIGTRVGWGQRIASQVGADDFDTAPGTFANTDYDTWLTAIAPTRPGGSSTSGAGRAIGVLTVAGDIVDGDAGPGSAGADRIAGLIDDALDDNLAALVVRVDSPGGTVTGSEVIRRALLQLKAQKIPIVVSMGNVAASGGYWVATPADRIFAEPETITGSIGVFAVIPTFENLLSQYGVNSDGVQTTPLSGQPDILGGFTPETEAVLQAGVEAQYARFVGLVAASRSITTQRADAIGQGRVWTGGAARQIGLVDQFGGLDDAIEWAAKQAKLDKGKWHVAYLGGEESGFSAMLASMIGGQARALVGLGAGADARGRSPAGGRDLIALVARGEQDASVRIIADLARIFAVSGAQARCMECVAALPAAAAPETDTAAFPRLVALLASAGLLPK